MVKQVVKNLVKQVVKHVVIQVGTPLGGLHWLEQGRYGHTHPHTAAPNERARCARRNVLQCNVRCERAR